MGKFDKLIEMQSRGRAAKKDDIDRMCADGTAEEFVEWLVARGSLDQFDSCIADNLREAFKWQRLRGRLDRSLTLAAFVEVCMKLKGLRTDRERKPTT